MTTAFVIYGPMGGFSLWFMFVVQRTLKDLSHRIDGMTRAMLIDVISRDSSGFHAKKAAQDMLASIEARDRK